jgi:hypothetical protein
MERNEAKREGRKTWKALKLGSEFRSKLQRAKARREGLYRVLGGDVPERPYFKVASHRYLAVRQEVSVRLAALIPRPTGISSEAWRSEWQKQVERETYDVLARENESKKIMGCGLNETEKKHLTQAAVSDKAPRRKAHATVVDDVLAHIGAVQKDNPTKLQTAWASVVGAEVASQTYLERVDAGQGTAWFRCFNSSLSFKLQRETGLALKLGRALGVKLKQVRACY